jgi:O-antigen ligase
VTAPSISDLPSASTLLALLASVLLVFVSVGVLYLSAVEWRDRRRRQLGQKPPGQASGSARAPRRAALPMAKAPSAPRS